MATSITVTVKGLEELQRKLADTPKPLKRMMFRVRGHLLKAAKEGAKPHPGDKGTLANTIKGSVTGTGVALTSRTFTSNPIAQDVEKGRSGSHMGVGQAILFKKRHPGVSLTVRQLIKLRKTRGVHFMEKAAEDTAAKLPEFIRNTEAQIEREFNS